MSSSFQCGSPARRRRPWAAALAVLILSAAIPPWAPGQAATRTSFPTLAVKNVRIVQRPGKLIDKGTIVIRDGRIMEVGRDVRIPPDGDVLDGEGLTVYPALIDGSTELGVPARLAEQRVSGSGPDVTIDLTRGALAATREVGRKGLFPDFALSTRFEPAEKDLQTWRAAGFGVVHAAPAGAILAGTSTLGLLLDPADAPRRSMIVAASPAMIGGWRASGPGYPASLMGGIAHLRQTLLDAQHYGQAWSLFDRTDGRSPRPPFDPALAALQPVLAGELPVVLPASSRDEILRALAFGAEFKLRVILEGGEFGHQAVERLKTSKTPVLLRIDFPEKPRRGAANLARLRALAARLDREVPRAMEEAARKADQESRLPEPERAFADRLRRWEERVANAKVLWEAGVPFAISTKGNRDSKTFRENLARAIEAGLSPEAALEALTLAPARILGAERSLGSIEVGKIANLMILDGEFAAEKASVRWMIVDGKKYEVRKPEEEAPQRARPARPDREGTETTDAPPQKEAQTAAKPVPEWPVETDADRRPKTRTGGNVLITGATLLTLAGRECADTSILVERGVIKAIGRDLRPPSGTTVIEGTGAWVLPGIIDCHSHMAIQGGVNEGTDSITAQVRIGDVVIGDDLTIYRAAAGGVTMANLLHGSANTIGGQRAIVRMVYDAPAEQLFFESYPRGIKFALGENVTRSTTRFPNTRMGVEAVIRRAFNEARLYGQAWEDYEKLPSGRKRQTLAPRRDLRLETLAGILDGSIWVHCHSYNADEIAMVLETFKEFGVKTLTLEHALEAYKVAPEVAAFGASVSTFADNWAYKIEAYDAIPYNAVLVHEAGANAVLNSDSGERVRRLNLEAAKMVRWGGVSYEDALRMVTLNPARALGVADRVGSIEVGKRADLALYNGHPLNSFARVFMTLVDGEVVFERPGERGGPYPLEPKRPAPTREIRLNPDGRYAIVNARIHPVTSRIVARGTLLIDDGKIAALGENVEIPGGTTVINADGLEVYPGLIDGGSTLGLTEIGSIPVTNDAAEGGLIQPDLRAAVALKPDSELVPVARFTGITTAVANPTGGLIPGQSALAQLNGWTPREMTVVDRLALEINFPRGAGSLDLSALFAEETAAARRPNPAEQIDQIKDLFARARTYATLRAATAARGERLTIYEPQLEALGPYVARERPVILNVTAAEDILKAIELAKELDVWAVLRGCDEGWKVAEAIAETGLDVLLDPVTRSPGDEYDPYDSVYAAPARLKAAGVKFGFQSANASDARNLPFNAAMAVAYGLSEADALRSVTINTAEILGLADRVGSLEVGKRADVIVTDRSPLQVTANVVYMFIDGRPIDVNDNKHTRLYEKYRARIPAVAGAAGL